MPRLTAEYVRSRLDYCPLTGLFIWRERPTVPGANDGGWNKRFAGKVAGTRSVQGYTIIAIDNRLYRANRLAWLHVHGDLPARVDHVDEVRSNNRLRNLRPATHAQNLWNRGRPKNNTSGVKGVFYDKRWKRWRAEICVNGRRIYLGRHLTREAAAVAYEAAAIQHHGEFANTGRRFEKVVVEDYIDA
jgi:hypothetical protein